MNFFLLVKKLGHPITLFGEKYNDVLNRMHFLNIITLKNFPEGKTVLKLKKLSSLKNNSKNKFTLQYYMKIEIRKKRYQDNRKIKEIFLSKISIEKCIYYRRYETKKTKNKKNNTVYSNYHSTHTYRMILSVPVNERQFCYQTGNFSFFSIKLPNKIVLTDLKKRKITHVIKSNLSNLNLLSSHPDFPLSFLANNKNSSEFWKITSFFSKISLNSIYHRDPINFQRYRKRESCIDFSTITMKWKCFDEIAQKYKFSSQFDEKILDITTSRDSNLSAISTSDHIYIFDNRIGKKIITLYFKRKTNSLLELPPQKSKLEFLQNGNYIRNNKKNLELDSNNLNCKKIEGTTKDSRLLFIRPKKKSIRLVNHVSLNSTQIINSIDTVKSTYINKKSIIISLFNKNYISFLHSR